MRALRPALLIASAAIVTSLLAGCIPGDDPSASPTARKTPAASGSSATTPEPSRTPSTVATQPPAVPGESGTPVALDCSQLITPQQIYDYNPNFVLIDDFTPDNGSLAGQAKSASGLVCQWRNQSSKDTIDVSVAKLDAASTATRKKSLAASNTSAPELGADGYFDQGDLLSTAQVFPGEYWITASSTAFYTAPDAEPLMTAAAGNLP